MPTPPTPPTNPTATSRHMCEDNTSVARPHRWRPLAPGFSLTELLVVIGIIVLLMGFLLVALRQVRIKALRTQTFTTMQQVVNACTAFQAEHGRYPGVIDEELLAATPDTSQTISSTENMLLHLMGGYRTRLESETSGPVFDEYEAFKKAAPAGSQFEFRFGAPAQMRIAIDSRRIGEGPRINGKAYAPYFTPSAGMLGVARGQRNDLTHGAMMPDLLDAWGQPIVYVRQVRSRGPLRPDISAGATAAPPQFILAGVREYIHKDDAQGVGLGELGIVQHAGDSRSIFFATQPSLTEVQRNNLWAAILSHQASYKGPSAGPSAPLYGAARGAFALISPGPDGIFFSVTDGPGTHRNPIYGSNIDAKVLEPGPRAIDEFDDIVVFGGG